MLNIKTAQHYDVAQKLGVTAAAAAIVMGVVHLCCRLASSMGYIPGQVYSNVTDLKPQPNHKPLRRR